MSKVSSVMNVGINSMRNNQAALRTTSHNISNKNVPGYSRQSVDFQSEPADTAERIPIGKGARLSAIKRESNEYLEGQIVREGNRLGYSEGRSKTLQRVEKVYAQMEKGIHESLLDFFNAFRELSAQPESLISRTLVREKAEYLVQDFQKINRNLGEIQKDIDFQITKHVTDINEITSEIVDINKRIRSIESVGQSVRANDERDRRNLLIKRLGKLVDIKYSEDKLGSLTITAGDSVVLVSGGESRKLFTSPSPERQIDKGRLKREGYLDIYYQAVEGKKGINVTRQFSSGQIGALLNTRDQTIHKIISDMDQLAFTLGKRVNEIHQKGYDAYNRKGEVFFILPQDSKDAAQKIEMSSKIKNDVKKIVTAAEVDSPADNRISNQIADLDNEKIMVNGRYTLGEFYRSLVGNVGMLTQRANQSFQSQRDALRQIESYRESVSGVNLDEETAKMIEFQKSYEASARLIRAAEEMLDTVLEIKKF